LLGRIIPTKRRLLWGLGLLLGIPLLYVVSVIAVGSLTDYSPPEHQVVSPDKQSERLLESDRDTFNALLWNIGYCGLGEHSDFFYDGGKDIRPNPNNYDRYWTGVYNYIAKYRDSQDFVLLQEVDRASRRSYHHDQYEGLGIMFDGWEAIHALNYKNVWNPMPLTEMPLGKIQSGLASFSRFASSKITRYSFPGNFSWPKSVFMLDRCFLVQELLLPSGKRLYMINSHNSAYDDGNLKAQQMDFLKAFLLKAYEEGNYIVVGADWNQCPPNFPYYTFMGEKNDNYSQTNIAEDFMPEGWQWVYDKTEPTNRKLYQVLSENPYEDTYKTLIDFYLVSPNIEVLGVKTNDLKFVSSDHQPVHLCFTLKD